MKIGQGETIYIQDIINEFWNEKNKEWKNLP